jgi:hypothetical protein
MVCVFLRSGGEFALSIYAEFRLSESSIAVSKMEVSKAAIFNFLTGYLSAASAVRMKHNLSGAFGCRLLVLNVPTIDVQGSASLCLIFLADKSRTSFVIAFCLGGD